MKRSKLMSLAVMLSFIATLMLGLSAFAAEKKVVTLDVKNMTCGMCAITVKKALKNVDGVLDAEVTLKPPKAVVTFDPGKTDVEALMKATGNAGYPSVVQEKD